ncbi:putative Na+/H+ antiporter [Sulfurirhabdus autotrophica]|uniref:Putative Na+/H+ antiporter n=1 Tax=Sulfurirhabdus autotrophica TaxID=1706046 RepID=A0A4R3YGC9_9PROT|nr:putative Na+/H+ antiporter [Sulfurirhabdus autotrophica]TCV90278.1 putative Na+/H+ antiporter [Sulfurirhabdus autotrophica]
MTPTTIQLIGATLFAVALIHTFSTKFFEHLAHTQPAHAGIWHLLGEVEVVFGFWAMILMVFMFATIGTTEAIQYIDSRNFTEPMFVFAIMVIAGTRAVLQVAMAGVRMVARAIPWPGSMSYYFTVLAVVPLLGSFITEPAAMTLAAMILADRFYSNGISSRLMYATLGVLFVNISIGGTLTSFAAPPVLMVASTWGWDVGFMMTMFGWKAAIAVVINALGVTLLFRKELTGLSMNAKVSNDPPVPLPLVLVHLAFLTGVVVFAHHPAIFMGMFLFFLGVSSAYQRHQERLILREGLLVAFFLAGLIVLGGQQQWWLHPVLMNMSSDAVFLGATVLTAVTDNAALTYLGSLVDGLSDGFKYALVAGAVTGGGLTIIANAPNPAGIAILRKYFEDETVHPIGLLLSAIPPTIVAALAFKFL